MMIRNSVLILALLVSTSAFAQEKGEVNETIVATPPTVAANVDTPEIAKARDLVNVFGECAGMMEAASEIQRTIIKDTAMADKIKMGADQYRAASVYYTRGLPDVVAGTTTGDKVAADIIAAQKPIYDAHIKDTTGAGEQAIVTLGKRCELADPAKKEAIAALNAEGK